MVCLGGWVNSGTKISASTGRTPANISRRCRGLLLFLFVSSSPVSLSLSLIPLAPSTPIHLSPLSLSLSRVSLFLPFPFLSFRLGRVVIFRKVSTRVRPTAETCIRMAIVRREMITLCTLEQTYDGGSSSSHLPCSKSRIRGWREEEEAGIGVSQPIWMTKGGRIPVVNASYLNLARNGI